MSREDDMKLPEGKTCADCCHVDRCKWLISVNPQNTQCDWAPSKFRDNGEQARHRSMEHFLRLARRGRPNTCASTGEVAARKLALAIIEYATGLDGEAAEGAAEFLKRAPLAPQLARQMIDAERKVRHARA